MIKAFIIYLVLLAIGCAFMKGAFKVKALPPPSKQTPKNEDYNDVIF